MEFENLLLTAANIVVFVGFVVMTILTGVVIVVWQKIRKGELDSADVSGIFSRIITPQFHVDFKVFVVITPFLLVYVIWFLFSCDSFRIPMILLFLIWIELLTILYSIKRLGST
jgi:hypothetical protein